MTEIALNEYVTKNGQQKAAELLGWFQGSVSKAVRRGRDIRLVFNDNGTFSNYYEIKRKELA
jgi:Cro